MVLPERDPCPFCENVAGRRECAVIARAGVALAFVNPRQYETGASLVVPERHVTTIMELDDQEASDMMKLAVRVARAMEAAFSPAGLNLIQNNGVTAGQSVPHAHIHVIPRYGTEPVPEEIATHPIAPFDDRLKVAERIRQRLLP